MSLKLSQGELRVIGCLIEKSLTTPDQYPLSLNALTNACNQKSSRDPVMSLSEIEVQQFVDALNQKNLILNQSGATSRVAKYRHRFCNTEFSDRQFDLQELAILCVLLLRGPQTPGELRTRTNRLCDFDNVQQTEEVLERLCQGQHPVLRKLPREPGKREARYEHCFADSEQATLTHAENESNNASIADSSSPSQEAYQQQIDELKEQMLLMQMELDELREKLQILSE